MNEIKIITELCAEDRQRIDTLTEALGYLAGQLSLLQKGPAYEVKKDEPDPVAELPEEVKPSEVPAEEHPVEQPFPEEEKEEAPEVPAVTKDDVRKLFVKLAASGKKEAARDIVTAFASSITDLPDAVVSDVYVKLAALGA